MSVRGADNMKYIHKLRDTCPFKSNRLELAQAVMLSNGRRRSAVTNQPVFYLPVLKSKNGMLKIDDKKVPGRKNDPSNVKVFMDALSRPLLFAKRVC